MKEVCMSMSLVNLFLVTLIMMLTRFSTPYALLSRNKNMQHTAKKKGAQRSQQSKISHETAIDQWLQTHNWKTFYVGHLCFRDKILIEKFPLSYLIRHSAWVVGYLYYMVSVVKKVCWKSTQLPWFTSTSKNFKAQYTV